MEYSFGKLAVVALTAFAFLFSGCKTDDSVGQSLAEVKTNKSATTYVVTVGMENSKFAGACPGAGIDAKRMTELLRAYSDNVVAFSSETAVKKDVVKAIENAVAKAELFIFFYSGHGGSDKFWDTGADCFSFSFSRLVSLSFMDWRVVFSVLVSEVNASSIGCIESGDLWSMNTDASTSAHLS